MPVDSNGLVPLPVTPQLLDRVWADAARMLGVGSTSFADDMRLSVERGRILVAEVDGTLYYFAPGAVT